MEHNSVSCGRFRRKARNESLVNTMVCLLPPEITGWVTKSGSSDSIYMFDGN